MSGIHASNHHDLGALHQASMTGPERRRRGAHYTPEPAILEHVVGPSLVAPFRARIQGARTLEALLSIREALGRVRVLDPACGSGNFLVVALQALRGLSAEIEGEARARFSAEVGQVPIAFATQLFGIDNDPRAVEIAKATLAAADGALPADLDDHNIRCDDALFCDWPEADVILGNPPFQSKNKMQAILGADYVDRLRRRYPGVPGRADYCVYWFRRAHDHLPPGGRAGLVGTNTIRENDSREGGLGYIVANGGTITRAVSTMVWPGDALVHVSVVNWIKGAFDGTAKLSWQEGDARESAWRDVTLGRIPPSLSARADVTRAHRLRANATAKACSEGQTPGHEGFLLTAEEARAICAEGPRNREVIFPYLTGDDLLAAPGGAPTRWVIDFHPRGEEAAREYEAPLRRVERSVLPDRERAAAAERQRNRALPMGKRGNVHHEGFLQRWWLFCYPRADLIQRLRGVGRYVACSRVAKRPIFEFVSAAIHPSDALVVFPLADDYAFGILQSSVHTAWLEARCSTLTARLRYTSETVFDSFPWPEAPDAGQVGAVAEAARALRALRRRAAAQRGCGLRALYASMDDPLKAAHAALDDAVRAAYGMGQPPDLLGFLLDLNLVYAAREQRGEGVPAPGLPPVAMGGDPPYPPRIAPAGLVTEDAIQPPRL